ncbi:MAG: tRNA pseudouridine(55) synthase TruB [SAR202 cluster bacterium]|nr:tRNA pseudouridine(55) synthase TruB [SAR202 cluster bacterium]|tara:strand:+ start:30173 stop:31105 length:933 start_codon:yes stop_codon:yes gene_type:complete
MKTTKNKLNLKSIHGILPIDKPHGVTSTEVVRQIKRVVGKQKVGHTGTLDPFATGVIPICIGQATRLTEFLINSTKEYTGVIELGTETNTYDSFGEKMSVKPTGSISFADVQSALSTFKGPIQQIPPIYSALKRNGKRMYDMARKGEEVILEPRPVEVFEIILESYEEPFAKIFVKCGKGFYMRSLAHDIGKILGTGAHMKDLRRIKTGPFSIKDCIALDKAKELLRESDYQRILSPADSALQHLKKVSLDESLIKLLQTGQSISINMGLPAGVDNELIRVYALSGTLIALIKYNQLLEQWTPKKVFNIT